MVLFWHLISSSPPAHVNEETQLFVLLGTQRLNALLLLHAQDEVISLENVEPHFELLVEFITVLAFYD